MPKARLLLIALAALTSGATCALAQGMPDHPSVVVDGQTYTPLSIVSGNMGSAAEQEQQFGPYHVIGNIYYVGTKTLSSFLIVTPKGDILMDTTYERNVPTILKSVKQLGYKASDIKIILGNHAHGDHMEGDALAKQLTGGAKVVVMAEDVPALAHMMPGGKTHPIDRVIVDGDTVSLGGTVLTAHLTAGHTHGCTSWTTTAMEKGKSYNVLFACSWRSPAVITPEVAKEFDHTFQVIRTLPCDVPLGDHGREYDMQAKYAQMKAGGPNPFIGPCTKEMDIEEAMYHAIMKEQAAAKAP